MPIEIKMIFPEMKTRQVKARHANWLFIVPNTETMVNQLPALESKITPDLTFIRYMIMKEQIYIAYHYKERKSFQYVRRCIEEGELMYLPRPFSFWVALESADIVYPSKSFGVPPNYSPKRCIEVISEDEDPTSVADLA